MKKPTLKNLITLAYPTPYTFMYR